MDNAATATLAQNTQEPLFSIIVPVYNVERYLRDCLDSLLAQTLQGGGFEVLLIDDGSTDSSGAIAQEYAKKEASVRYISQSNGGSSKARNTGLANARGKYIVFVDSDDMLENGALAYFADIFQSHSDVEIIYTEFKCISDEGALLGRQKFWFDLARFGESVQSGEVLLASLEEQKKPLFTYTWQGAMRRSFIERYQLRFYEGIFFVEDILFGIRAFSRASAVYVSKQSFHLYRQSIVSVSRGAQSASKLQKSAHSYLTTAREILKLKEDAATSPKIQSFLLRCVRTLSKRVMRIYLSLDSKQHADIREGIYTGLKPLLPYAPLRVRAFAYCPTLSSALNALRKKR